LESKDGFDNENNTDFYLEKKNGDVLVDDKIYHEIVSK
jgi:hypothetical protein